MLPASRAATLAWLALLLAGKTPVMLNWTTGAANFRHCIELAGIRTVLTSRHLLQRIEELGFDAGAAAMAGADWFCLEDVAQYMGLHLKMEALIRSRLTLWGWERAGLLAQPPEIAVLLFTSGSEAAPKGVPLSHANIMSNCRDIASMLSLSSHDCMLGMLPPFHSLGLTGNVALPLCFGLPTVYHPSAAYGARLSWLGRHPFWMECCSRPMMTNCAPCVLASWGQRPVRGEYAMPFLKRPAACFLRATALPNVRPVSAAIGLKTLCRVLSAILSPRWKWH